MTSPTQSEPDPVPEAAVEAGAYSFVGIDGTETFGQLAVRVLTAALETGTLIAVPQDEQGRRELVQRAAVACKREFGDGVPVNGSEWREAASAVLQALGLLPEQEEARDADGALVAAPGTPSPEQEEAKPCFDCDGTGGGEEFVDPCPTCKGTGRERAQ